ncbi:8616_t:CDS:2 [Scutellospora calospora]|uniref:8616_t:CDS:1 n=1 Tax=Scutellospora calospora TaxID=85575 RepID=A0ACA9L877_9GLOM|nr:8616_t:CDS:2 [Scutellospora calospora]
MQQSPLQHENPQTSTISQEANSTQNVQTPPTPQTRDPTSHVIATSSQLNAQLSAQRSPFVVGLAAWVPPAGASTAASETVATPVTKNVQKASTSVSQNIKAPDIFSHQAAFPIQQMPFKHLNPTQPVSVVAISALLEPDQRTEELLGALSIEQLSSIEKTIQRVKRKKNRELKKHINDSTAVNNNLNNNPATHARVEHSVSNTNTTPMLAPNPLPSPVNASTTTTISFVSSNVNNRVQAQDQQIVHQQQHQQPNLDHQQHRTQQQPVQQTQNHSTQPQQNILIQTQTASKQQSPEISNRPRRSDVPITNPNPNHALPATDPIIEEFEGVQWVVFTYSVKGNNKEYRIRIDIDRVNLDEIDEQFRHDNCLYPRANCTEDKYQGNRWSYENECNALGWKLAWLNQEEISGRRGLLQRAVDSYRNRDPSLRSRRVVRNEKIMNGTLRKRVTRDNDSCDASSEISAKRPRGANKQLTVEYTVNEDITKIRIRADIECVNLSEISDDFKKNNSVYPKAAVAKANYQGTNWEHESACNELGWKLAHLNSTKLNGNILLLQKAIETYHAKYTSDIKPRRGRYSHTLSSKFFENHPREVNSDATTCATTSLSMKEASHQTTPVIATDAMVMLTPSDSKSAVISMGKAKDLNIAENNPLETNKD